MFLLGLINWKPDELNAIAAIGGAVTALFAAIIAAYTAYWQRKALHQDWESNSASMVTKFVDDWYSRQYKICRKRFAKQLLEVREAKRNDPQADNLIKKVGIVDVPVLSFFENVGYLTRRGVLDRGMVWNKFYWEIERYYLAITQPADLLKEYRKGDQSTLYREFEWLYEKLLSYDRQERGIAIGKGDPDANDMETFLKEESTLEIPSP